MLRAFTLLTIVVLGACASTAQTSITQDQIAGRWRAVRVNGRQSDNPPTLAFLEGGHLSAGAMCNGISGAYQVDADAILIQDTEMTLLGCRQSPSVARQHSSFMAMLRGRLRVEAVSADTMELRADDGSTMRLTRY
jgi:heat shock protein HslJ